MSTQKKKSGPEVSEQTKKIYSLIEEGKTNEEIAKTLNMSNGAVRNQRSLYNRKHPDNKIPDPNKKASKGYEEKVEQEKVYLLQEDVKARKINAEIKYLKDKNTKLVTAFEELTEKYDQALLIKENTGKIGQVLDLSPIISSEAMPIIQWSDWHVGEKIERSTTFGLNEFNPEIASDRVKKLTLNTLKLIRKERQDVKIKEILVCLGGDFINNFLHDHDVQENTMAPLQEVVLVKTFLVEALKSLAENGDFKKIIIVAIRGNHGRLTKRMQSSNDYKLNWEAILYHMLKQELKSTIFEWHIPESELGYVKVLGKTIRSFHGHQVSYQGGVGDLTIPCNKAIMKWDKTIKADWNLMHHYHSFWMPTRNTSLNGSLCGWNSYASSIGAPYEPAQQTFHLLDSKRGFTVRTPIHCE